MSSVQRIAITGAAGMIGQVVARRLARDGHELVLLDKRRGDAQLPDAPFVEGDLRDHARVVETIARADVVLHIGEIPNIGLGLSDAETFATNVATCRSMLDAAVAVGARRFVYTSSCQQYGYWGTSDFDHDRTPARWPIDEFLPAAPRNAYAHSKAANELACRETSARTDLEVFIYRFPWVMPHRAERKVIERWGAPETAHVDGLWTYLHIDDAAEAFALAVSRDRPVEPMPSSCEAFHFVADDVLGPTPTREKLARFLPKFAALPDDWPARRSPVSCAKAARYLGWRPAWRITDHVGPG